MKRIAIFITLLVSAALLWIWVDRPAVNNAQAKTLSAITDTSSQAVATLAGGCFWCMESTFEKIEGVSEVVSGYTGGHLKNPTYHQVGSGTTGHTEAVQVFYDPDVISFAGLLHYFWREIDPTDSAGQFVDRGSMYRPAIYYHNEQEKMLAIAAREQLQASERFTKPITVEITPAQPFYKAEGYHQNYHVNHPHRYKIYRLGSGRDQYLKKTWGSALHAKYDAASAKDVQPIHEVINKSALATPYTKPQKSALKQKLTRLQFDVTQHDATEPPFRNAFWDNKRDGIYVDVVSGEPLFSSTDKYRSGTGWPSFSQPIDKSFIVEKQDFLLLFPRTEVRSRYGDSHLGHIFDDGPPPTGLRYCINSASMDFIAVAELEQKGYGKYTTLFE